MPSAQSPPITGFIYSGKRRPAERMVERFAASASAEQAEVLRDLPLELGSAPGNSLYVMSHLTRLFKVNLRTGHVTALHEGLINV